MARADWIALVTEPSQEYVACTELERFGLSPYLPQIRRRWIPPHGQQALVRLFPLFPKYLLLPAKQSTSISLRNCRGLRKYRPILSNNDGRPWLAPDRHIALIMQAESSGEFDEFLHVGDRVKITRGVLQGLNAKLQNTQTNGIMELLAPLFGGVRLTVNQAQVARA